MFNIIKTSEKCPKCGSKIDEWQSKNLSIKGYPIMQALINITLVPDMAGEMHAICDKCKTWTEYKIKNGQLVK
ncbi:hypothetical protein HYW54_01280 [Candidatus Gottesmanbacteria bacterium]|nr:hypothetical protein [Candidatus Gottesmanbacteria bacterium]